MNPKRLFQITGLLMTLGLLAPPEAAAQLRWRISVKMILNASGNRPSSGILNTDAEIIAQIDNANEVLDATGRGYRFQLTEIVDLAGVSQWYNSPRDKKDELEAAAEGNKTLYAYRDNAINVYINGNSGSAICSFPANDDLIFMGQGSRSTSIFHECGHYFDLRHTHSGEDYQNSNGSDCTNKCSCAMLIGGTGDGIPDTIADHQCWDTANEIAQGNFGVNYSSLSTGNKERVNNVLFNMMSYHGTRNRLTSDQLDRMTDTSNGSRFKVASGRTVFVDRTGVVLFEFGSSSLPHRTVARGVNLAGSGDIVLVRPGRYNEPQTITKRVTLRATRGNAVIGLP